MAMALDSFKSPMAVGLEILNWRMTSADETAPFACINSLMSNSFLITLRFFVKKHYVYKEVDTVLSRNSLRFSLRNFYAFRRFA